MRNFDLWLSNFRDSISDYKYYTSFENVYNNTDVFRIELNILNSLIGSKNIENDFLDLLNKYPEVLKAIPILLAKREEEIFCMDNNGSFNYNFKNKNYSNEQYCYFMKETGLFDLISNKIIANLYDYVLGVNTGLDSNGRKNRGGHLMENLVESFLEKHNLKYKPEVYINTIEAEYGLDLSRISNNGEATKRFDFVIEGNKYIYGVECNFYSSGGSKLNETARSYKMIAEESKDIKGFKFVWFTDGKGWHSARKNLKETFDILEDLYNIDDLEQGILDKIIK